MPDNLLESELFGYVKGAFTDAKKDKPGKFSLAHTGTILLDEIGDISPSMQTKLLRVLQEREFEPLGGVHTVKVNIKVIASTNANLSEKVVEGRFREDLFYRLNVIRIQIPPLSQRVEDIPLLVSYFIDRFNKLQGKRIKKINNLALHALMETPLHGNVRELENAIEYAFVLCRRGTIDLHHLPPQYIKNIEQASTIIAKNPFKSAEANIIRAALKRNKSNRTQTAKELGISRNTLWRKMKKLDVSG